MIGSHSRGIFCSCDWDLHVLQLWRKSRELVGGGCETRKSEYTMSQSGHLLGMCLIAITHDVPSLQTPPAIDESLLITNRKSALLVKNDPTFWLFASRSLYRHVWQLIRLH